MRKKVGVAAVLLLALCAQAQGPQNKGPQNKDPQNKDAAPQKKDAARIEKPEVHEFVIANFKTESGVTLPQAKIVYGTYGHLDAARDNAVLLPSHYMANHHGYDWLIRGREAGGPPEARALDPASLFLIATELFGNGQSS